MRTKLFTAFVAVAVLAMACGAWTYARGKTRADSCCYPGSECCFPGSPCCDGHCGSCAKPDTCCQDCCPECLACCAEDGCCWECFLCCLQMGCDPLCCFPDLTSVRAPVKSAQPASKKVSGCCSEGCCE
jgi:hypothetical protein